MDRRDEAGGGQFVPRFPNGEQTSPLTNHGFEEALYTNSVFTPGRNINGDLQLPGLSVARNSMTRLLKDLDLQSGKALLTAQSSPVRSGVHFAKGVISWDTGDGSVGQVFVKKSRRPLAATFSRIKTLITRNPDRFLKKVSSVVHVGANIGHERDVYRKFGLRVIWIEPIPDVFQRLKANLTGYPEQLSFQYLITDQNNSEYLFHVANNAGQSSSILDFAMHKDIWPHVGYESALRLRSIALSSFFRKERINATDYQALVMDTQGRELLVLKGS